MVCLLSTNGVNTNPPPVRAREETASTSHLSNTLVPRGGGGGRGRGGAPKRGMPGRGAGAARGDRHGSERRARPDEVGKVPGDYKKFKDTAGNEVCVKFNKENGCSEVTRIILIKVC